jgi:hypothetical protein
MTAHAPKVFRVKLALDDRRLAPAALVLVHASDVVSKKLALERHRDLQAVDLPETAARLSGSPAFTPRNGRAQGGRGGARPSPSPSSC